MKKLIKKMRLRNHRESEMYDWGAYDEAEEARRLYACRSSLLTRR